MQGLTGYARVQTITYVLVLPYRTHTRFLLDITDLESISVTVSMRMLNFAISCVHSTNPIVHSLSNALLTDNRSIIGRNVYSIFSPRCNISNVAHIFTLNKRNILDIKLQLTALAGVPDDMIWRIGFIRDILSDNTDIDADIRSILLDYLCCN